MVEEFIKSQLRLASANLDIYRYLVDEEKLFNSFLHLFSFALVYAILQNKKDEKKIRTTFIPISQISSQQVRDVLLVCYMILNDGRPMKDIYEDLMAYADEGVIAVNEIYKKNKSFILSNLINDSEKLWQERVKDLKNIRLEKST